MNDRRKLPDERKSVTHKFQIKGHEIVNVCPHCDKEMSRESSGCKGYVNVGLFEDGTPGELFITLSRVGSTQRGFADSFAKSVSHGWQYGVPFQKTVSGFRGTMFEPMGYTTNPKIPQCSSIVDYVVRWLELQFPEPMPQYETVEKKEDSDDPENT